jgi:hypothetical protein
MRLLPGVAIMLIASGVSAQPTDSAAAPPVVQDNSFLVEEAYNQEAGIVQHISTFAAQRGSSGFDFNFAQEWPLFSIRHQLSFDLPVIRSGSSTGLGDVALNYRYQLLGDGHAKVAIAPRVSVLVPTGDWKRGRGNGAMGGEAAIAVSFVPSRLFVAHTNAGISFTPNARNISGERDDVHEYSLGQSLIFTASHVIQPLVEVVYSDGSFGEQLVISPGVRAAFNFSSGLQIVPGIAAPLGAGSSSGEKGVFVYLSFEHPFKR